MTVGVRTCGVCRVRYDEEDMVGPWCAGCFRWWSPEKPRWPRFHIFRCERCDHPRWTLDRDKTLCRECRYATQKWSVGLRTCAYCRGRFRPARRGAAYCSDECAVVVPKAARAVRLKLARQKGRHTEVEWLNLLADHNYQCVYCGVRSYALTKDHDIPLARNGSDSIANILPACGVCNSRKGALTAAEYRAKLAGDVAA